MPERYEILGKIARGGIGAIYRARDKVMGREVAIKRLLPLEETRLNQSADESLQREAAALARFQHPNVVSIFAFEQDEEGPYVVMELVEGETLKETVERAAFPLEDFVELTLQVLDSLVAAGELSLLHRDIKPSNIMISWLVTGRFQVKVLDFGLSKFSQKPSLQTLDQTGSFLGSIDYLAPEQLELEPLDQRTDIYSLGCVLYYCLTQKPPFEGNNAARTMRNHLAHVVAPLAGLRPDLPSPLAAWLMRMISRYPSQRPDDARAALEEFHAALREAAGEPASGAVAEDDVPVAMLAEDPTPRGSSGPVVRLRTGPLSHAEPEDGDRQPGGKRSARLLMPAAGAAPRRSPEDLASRGKRVARAIQGKRPAKPSPGGRQALFLAAVVVVLLALALSARNCRASKPGLARQSPSQAPPQPEEPAGLLPAAASPPSPAPPLPAMVNPALPPEQAGTPAVTEGLVARYAAGSAVFGPDFKAEAELGQRVTWWGNLAPGAAPGHLLAVDPRHPDLGPILEEVTPERWPELARPMPLLRFDGTASLMSQAPEAIRKRLAGDALTQFLVLRISGVSGPLLDFAAAGEETALALEGTARGCRAIMPEGSIEASLGGARERLVVLTHAWNGEEVEQTLHATLPGGRTVLAAAGGASFKPVTMERYRWGGTADDRPAFEVWLAEWLVYDRVLDEEERAAEQQRLAVAYFAPGQDSVIDFVSPQPAGPLPQPRNPETNAATAASPPLLAGDLAARHVASDFAFGHDLRRPVEPGQRVMAWANLAPGAAADQLLAFPPGTPERSPLLAEADPAGYPGLAAPVAVVRFAPGQGLASLSPGQVRAKLGGAFTCILVVQADPAAEPQSILSVAGAEPPAVVEIFARPEGFAAVVGGSEGAPAALAETSASGFCILSLEWDPAGSQIRLRVKPSGGAPPATAHGHIPGAPDSPRAVESYRLGWPNGGQEGFSGRIAEVLLYRKALAQRERDAVESHLAEIYFAP